MTDKYRPQNSFENLSKKYGGTGNPDITKWEFERNLQKDIIGSTINNFSKLNYYSVALNEHPLKTRLRMMNRFVLANGTVPNDLKSEFLDKSLNLRDEL